MASSGHILPRLARLFVRWIMPYAPKQIKEKYFQCYQRFFLPAVKLQGKTLRMAETSEEKDDLVTIGFSAPASMKARLEELAKREQRPMSNMIRILLQQAMERGEEGDSRQ